MQGRIVATSLTSEDLVNHIKKLIQDFNYSFKTSFDMYEFNQTNKIIEKQLDQFAKLHPKEKLNKDNVTLLLDLFKIRDVDYTKQPDSPTNMIFLALAQMLEGIVGINRYQLLMPKITNTYSHITLTDFARDDDVQLRHFVLSDDDTTPIDIIACLEFAEEDGILRHTSLINGEIKELSESEIKRVTQHSQYTLDYYKSIQMVIAAKNNKTSFGGVLKVLRDGLRNGSVGVITALSTNNERAKVRKQENNQIAVNKDSKTVLQEINHSDFNNDGNAKSPANIVIAQFISWFNALNREDKAKLLKLTSDRGSFKVAMQQIMRINSFYIIRSEKEPTLTSLYSFDGNSYYDVVGNFIYCVDKNKRKNYPILVKEYSNKESLQNIDKELQELAIKSQLPILLKHGDAIYIHTPVEHRRSSLHTKTFSQLNFSEHNGKVCNSDIINYQMYGVIEQSYNHVAITKLPFGKKIRKPLQHILSSIPNKGQLLSLIDTLEIFAATDFDPTPLRDEQCTNALADHIDLILKNSSCYDMYPSKASPAVETQTMQVLNALVDSNKKNFIRAIGYCEYKFTPSQDILNECIKRVSANIHDIESLYKIAGSFNGSDFRQILPFIDINLLVQVDLEVLVTKLLNYDTSSIESIYTYIKGDLQSIDRYVFGFSFNTAKFIDEHLKELPKVCKTHEDLTKIFKILLKKNKAPVITTVVDILKTIIPTFFKTMDEYVQFYKPLSLQATNAIVNCTRNHFPKLVVDYPSLKLGLSILAIDDKKELLKHAIHITRKLTREEFKNFLSEHPVELNEVLITLRSFDLYTLADDFGTLLSIIQYSNESCHLLILKDYTALLLKNVDINQFIRIAPLFNTKCQAKLIDVFKNKLLSTDPDIDVLITLISKIDPQNLPDIFELFANEFIKKVSSIKSLDELFIAFRGVCMDKILALFMDTIPSLIKNGTDLIAIYKWILPSELKPPFLSNLKPRLATLIEDGSQLAILNKDLNENAIEIFDTLNLHKLINTASEFVACTANQAFQATMIMHLVTKIPALTAQFEDFMVMLDNLIPANRDKVATLLLGLNLLNRNINDPVKFLKLLIPFYHTPMALKIIQYLNEKMPQLTILVLTAKNLASVLKVCSAEDHQQILRMINLLTLIKSKSDLDTVLGVLEKAEDCNYVYQAISSNMAAIMGFQANKPANNLPFDAKLLLTETSEEEVQVALSQVKDGESTSVNLSAVRTRIGLFEVMAKNDALKIKVASNPVAGLGLGKK